MGYLVAIARSGLGRIFNLEVLAEEEGKNDHAGKKAGKRSEALHVCSGVGVLRKRECSCAGSLVAQDALPLGPTRD